MGSVALWHVGSSPSPNWTCVPCIGRQILNHWTTRKPSNLFLISETGYLLGIPFEILLPFSAVIKPCAIWYPKQGQVCVFSELFFVLFCFVFNWLYWVFIAMWALVSVTGLLVELASHFAEHGLQGAQASVGMARGHNSCDSWTLEHRLSSCGTLA